MRLKFGIALSLVFSHTQLFATETKSLDSAIFYGESKSAIQLYLKTTTTQNEVLMSPAFQVPEGSILAIDTETMAKTIEIQKTKPTEVNFLYFDSATGSNKLSKNGWVCGVDVTDVLDEEVRSSPQMEVKDYCLSLTMLRSLTIMDGNGDAIKSVANLALNNQDDTGLQKLASQLARIRSEQEAMLNSNEPMEIAGLGTMGSPIAGCADGCLTMRSGFGMRFHPVLKRNRLHKGIDLRASIGTPVASVYDGRVLANRTERNRKTGKVSGYGYYTLVTHPDAKMVTLYAHLSRQLASPGTNVDKGEKIALSGASGIGTGPHLHFEVHPIVRGAEQAAVNPRPFLKHLLD